MYRDEIVLTSAQLRYLSRAFDLVLRFGRENCRGVYARGGGHRALSKLEALGLVAHACVTDGCDIDGNDVGIRAVYGATRGGAQYLRNLGKVSTDELRHWKQQVARHVRQDTKSHAALAARKAAP